MNARDQAIAELNREFDAPGSTMHVETFKAKLAEIKSRSDEAPAPAATAPVDNNQRPVTLAFLRTFTAIFIEDFVNPLRKRLLDLETHNKDMLPLRDNVTATIQQLERRASRHADHLQALETRLKRLEHK